MSSQMRGLYDEVEVEIWVNNVIQHTADIPSLNKSKEHPDPLNPLGDLPPESTGSHSESSRGRSPSKRLPPKLSPTKGRDQLSDRASDYTSEFTLQSKRKFSKSPTHGNRNMAHLEICNPPILRKSVQACKKEMKGQLPKLVDNLVNDLYYNAPSSYIPLKLRVSKVSVARNTP